ncbi:unnamed protein product [Thelazia callipaeda]|uniref:PCI domain-containing protein n=1 Tax=Thelazia callipaeda TaxID=103827 RepID=A0A0N5CWK5_THECL|nr:unnamed protein product [Thelazia callipaeda]
MSDVHLTSIRNASNAEEVISRIKQIVEANDVFTFAQFLSEPAVEAIKNDEKHHKYYTLLQVFAYGVYADSVTRKDELPDLTEAMIEKLRLLTLITMCNRSKIFSIKDAMNDLQISDQQTFYRLFISAVYSGIIQGRLNCQKGEVEAFSWKSRDVADDELDAICHELHKWIQQCNKIKEELSRVAKIAEDSVTEAAEREKKVLYSLNLSQCVTCSMSQ